MRSFLVKIVGRAREWDAPLRVKLAWGYLGFLALLIVGAGLVYAPLVLLSVVGIVGVIVALIVSIIVLTDYYP